MKYDYEEKIDIIKAVFRLCRKLPDDDLFPILEHIWNILEKQDAVKKPKNKPNIVGVANREIPDYN